MVIKMKKKALYKDIKREIKKSYGRFFSIMALIMLGVAFFVGLKAVGPNMKLTATDYFNTYQLADVEVQSTLGLDESDRVLLEQVKDVKEVELGYCFDALLQDSSLVTKVYALSDMNAYQIKDGRLPSQSGEVAIDENILKSKQYAIGDEISFVQNDGSAFTDTFKQDTYTIVGIVSSPKYIEKDKRGNSTFGNGVVDGFAVILENDIDSDVFTLAMMTFTNTEGLETYSTAYEEKIEQNVEAVEQVLSGQPTKKLHDLQEEIEAEIAEAEAEVEEGKQELAKQEQQLADAKQQLEEAKAQYEAMQANGLTQQAMMIKAQVDESEADYERNAALFQKEKTKAEQELRDAEAEIQATKEDVAALEEPVYYVTDRTSNPGYAEYRDNANRLASMATVFPVLFFLVAILVCLTTMTRMVEEQRTQIGLLKALGYRKYDIMAKFLLYGSLAGIIGAGIGLVIGFEFLPRFIFDAYGIMYDFADLKIVYYPKYILLSVGVALLCTGVTAVVTTWAELKENAATLMRPKAPKIGKRILLERIGFVWKRFNFTSKVTARNIFRYKKRMFMTIFGVAGCTALIFTGYALRGSINDIVPKQYEEIMKFDAMIIKDVNAPEEDVVQYEKLLQNPNDVSSRTTISQTIMTGVQKGANNQDVTIVVPKSVDEYEKFISLRDRKNHQQQHFSDEGAIITEKLARVFDLEVGDVVTLQNTDNKPFQVKVTGISEMYFGHYLYMTESGYQSIFGEDVSYNTDLVMLKDTSTNWQNEFSEKLVDCGAVSITFANEMSKVLNETMESLNVVVVILIVSAALLAFVVLYNLTNINVSERIRELSTIKVLGFYPAEVTMYVYRENIFLTLLGILFGYILGYFLHGFVISTAEIDQMMMSRTIHWDSYVYSALLTLLFSSVVMMAMHWKLKSIDMIEALKSVD